MPRRRHHKKSSSYSSKPYKVLKYSNETYGFNATLQATSTPFQYTSVLVPAISVLGTRKCKYFTLSILTQLEIPCFFAVVYVPEGTTPMTLQPATTVSQSGITAQSIYEPNQNVIMSGIFGGNNSQVERFRSTLSRNLNSGDSIQLLILPSTAIPTNAQCVCTLNYGIAF